LKLIINKYEITAPIIDILNKLKSCSNGYLDSIVQRGDNIFITCPFHKDGHENKPSCSVYCRNDNPDLEYGIFNCFTCSSKGPLYKLVAQCLKCSTEVAKTWLVDYFGSQIEDSIIIPEISIPKDEVKFQIDESELNNYRFYHPYMWERKLSKEVVDMFSVGYDGKTDALTFPVWDDANRLVMITKRNVSTKSFYIPPGVEKPVYLLNFVKNWGITKVWVMESQINALYGWTMGYPSIGLIGTGSSYQHERLIKSGISVFHLCFDGDTAGDLGAYKFAQAMPRGILVDQVIIPRGKDVNDLSFEEFSNLQKKILN